MCYMYMSDSLFLKISKLGADTEDGGNVFHIRMDDTQKEGIEVCIDT